MGGTEVVSALVPAAAFLVLLVFMDSYKLVPAPLLVRALLVGLIVAIGCSYLNRFLLEELAVSGRTYQRYLAPIVEEGAKAIPIIFLLRSSRVGFLVDSAILGFAVGTGFAIAENIYYLNAIGDASLVLWLLRGFGTAIMHGSTTAILALLSKELIDRKGSEMVVHFVPGLVAAVVLHSVYNHFLLPAALMAALNMVSLPLILVAVFSYSERVTKKWLGASFDDDAELLQVILSGEVPGTILGNYLSVLREKFPATVVVDMLCLLRVHLELAVRAKGILLARESGIDLPVGDDIRASFKELDHLKRSIGRTGQLAIQPFLGTSQRDLWQLYHLRDRE